MRFRVGDKVRYVGKGDADNVKVGEVGIIRGISSNGDYAVDFEESGYKHSCDGLCQSNHGWWCKGDALEPVALTLADIKEKKLTCCINVKNIAEAQFLDAFFECKSYLKKYCENAYKERMRLGYYRVLEDGVAFQLTDGVINDCCSANFYRSCGSRYGEVYEFSDLFPVGSTMMCGDRMYQRTESGITNYKLVPKYKEGQGENHFCNGFRGGKKPEYVLNEKQAKEYADNIMATAKSISHITGIPYENSINKLKTCLSAFPNDGISAKNGGKNSMKIYILCNRGLSY